MIFAFVYFCMLYVYMCTSKDFCKKPVSKGLEKKDRTFSMHVLCPTVHDLWLTKQIVNHTVISVLYLVSIGEILYCTLQSKSFYNCSNIFPNLIWSILISHNGENLRQTVQAPDNTIWLFWLKLNCHLYVLIHVRSVLQLRKFYLFGWKDYSYRRSCSHKHFWQMLHCC